MRGFALHGRERALGCEQAHSVADAVARRSYGKLIAYLAARTGDVAGAEDALADAFAEALAHWPESGCPQNPEAWLLTVARRKGIDRARHRQYEDTTDEDLEQAAAVLETAEIPDPIPDRRLALLFACAHPALEPAVRAPLMLQAVMGLDAARIATAFLVSPAAMSKRLVRAKSKIREAGIPFRVPEREELAERLDAVLEAIYAAYTEGWADAAGTDAFRQELSGEAIFLTRLVAELLPGEPEALGLCALVLYAEARRRARRDAAGNFVPFARQEVARWDRAMIDEAEALLRCAGTAASVGRYQLEAALQSAHIARRRKGWNNWADVLGLYDALLALTESPVVAVNRALAVAEVEGPAAGLRALPDLEADARLRTYQPYWAVRAELLARAGDAGGARHAYEVAIGLERDPAIQEFLREKQVQLER